MAPLRGLILNENAAFMNPGGALVLDNWFPTDAAIKLRGGSKTWTKLGNATTPDTAPVRSMFNYIAGSNKQLFAANDSKIYNCTAAADYATLVTPAPNSPDFNITNGNYSTVTYATIGGTTYLLAVNDNGDPVLRYNGTSWVWLDPSTIAVWANNTDYALGALAKDISDTTYWRCLVAHTSATSGTFAADRTAHPTYWSATAADGASWITGPTGSPVAAGRGLTQTFKYRNRVFFVQAGSMNAWYLQTLDAIGGQLGNINLAGAATLGGTLLLGCAWSVSAGDGIDDKCVFVTTEGEVLIFTGTNPGDPQNWRQQGRYQIAKPLGKNAWLRIGGDVLIITVDGLVPISQCLTKDIEALEFSALTVTIRQLWKSEVLARNNNQWTLRKWDEYGGIFITLPGGGPGEYKCFVTNTITGAWCRFTGWDMMCLETLSGNMFFGTQNGRIIQADIGGTDEGSTLTPDTSPRLYVCSYVGGWETFGAPPNTFVVRQGRCSFNSLKATEPFVPQVTMATNYSFDLPPPPDPGPDPGLQEVWDEGLWGSDAGTPGNPIPPGTTPEPGRARWDQGAPIPPNTRTTYWVSIGETGWAHAPIVQVSVYQAAKPTVEMLGVTFIAEPAGVAV
jgi:hypothetical protein